MGQWEYGTYTFPTERISSFQKFILVWSYASNLKLNLKIKLWDNAIRVVQRYLRDICVIRRFCAKESFSASRGFSATAECYVNFCLRSCCMLYVLVVVLFSEISSYLSHTSHSHVVLALRSMSQYFSAVKVTFRVSDIIIVTIVVVRAPYAKLQKRWGRSQSWRDKTAVKKKCLQMSLKN